MGALDNMCRLCGEKLDPVTSTDIFAPGSSRVLSTIVQCMPITIREDDPYPKIICKNCDNTLNAVNELQTKSLSVASVFSRMLSTETDGNGMVHVIKQEEYDIELEDEPEYKYNVLKFSDGENRLPAETNSQVPKETKPVGDKKLTKEKPFECEFCQKRYSDKSSFKKHLLVHTSEKVFFCQDCPKSFYHRSSLISHQMKHAGVKTFFCPFCNRCYYDKSTLTKHLRIHTGEKPFQCQQCGKSFAVRAILLIHERTHTAEKKYQCDQCNKFFSEKSYLRKHQTVHSGEKPFECLECGRKFRHRATLKSHQKTHLKESLGTQCNKPVSEEMSLVAVRHPGEEFTIKIERPDEGLKEPGGDLGANNRATEGGFRIKLEQPDDFNSDESGGELLIDESRSGGELYQGAEIYA